MTDSERTIEPASQCGRLLIVEDDRSLRETLSETFEAGGYEVHTAKDGREAETALFARHYDLILLDVMLPHRNGIDLLRDLRRAKVATPVLLLTVKNRENDKVVGFDAGADDYVTKPFSLRELEGRVRALVRRGRAASPVAPSRSSPTVPGRFRLGPCEVDLEQFVVTSDDARTPLSQKEARMLALLAAVEGRVVTRDEFLEQIWGDDVVSHRTIDTHVLHLRQKVEPDPTSPRYLVTVHGVGYRLEGARAPDDNHQGPEQYP